MLKEIIIESHDDYLAFENGYCPWCHSEVPRWQRILDKSCDIYVCPHCHLIGISGNTWLHGQGFEFYKWDEQHE
jgi:hypothetical protein